MKNILSENIGFLVFVIVAISVLVYCWTAGAKEVVSVETENVEVVVVDADYDSEKNYPVIVNGMCGGMITEEEEYLIVVVYDNVHYYFEEEETYEKYKDMVGQTVTATLEIRTYDNGKKRQYIILE